MTVLGTSGVNTAESTKKFVSSFITAGINKLKIIGIEAKDMATSGGMIVTFKVETPPVTDENFNHPDKAAGQTGNVSLTLYLDQPKSVETLNLVVGAIADKLGLRERVDAIKASTPKEYIAILASILCNGAYAYYVVAGREYEPGKVGLSFPRYRLCKSLTEVDEESAVTDDKGRITFLAAKKDAGQDLVWDVTSIWHWKPFVQKQAANDADLNPKPSLGTASFLSEEPISDLPFDAPSEGEPEFGKEL